jgi:hypothetical protein
MVKLGDVADGVNAGLSELPLLRGFKQQFEQQLFERSVLLLWMRISGNASQLHLWFTRNRSL